MDSTHAGSGVFAEGASCRRFFGWAAIFFLLALFLFPAGPASATVTEFSVCTAAGEQNQVAISGTIVVWADYRNVGGSDIYGKDLATGMEFAVCTAPGYQVAPAISGDIVVWQDGRAGFDIYGKNLTTGVEFPICTAAGSRGYPAISGDIVVWCDYRSGDGDIYGYNLATGVEFPVCVMAYEQQFPDVSGDIVVWTDARNATDYNIYGKNLATGLEFAICMEAGNQTYPRICGDTVTWTDFRSGNYDIIGMDLTTGAEYVISAAAGDQVTSDISGALVIWEDHRAPEDGIYGCDPATGAEFPVCTAAGAQMAPAISGNTVVWADSRSGNCDIYGATIAPNRRPVASDDSAVTYEDNQVSIPVLANDSDPDGDALSISGVTLPSHGAAVISGNRIVYTPATDYSGPDAFTYTLTDGALTATATVNVTVIEVDDTPMRVAEAWRAGGFTNPQCVSVNTNDNSVWVADTNRGHVVHLDESGAEVWRGFGFLMPSSVSVSTADDTVWVAETYSHQVAHLSPSGAFLWRGGSYGSYSVAVNPTDRSVWVADTINLRLLHLGEDGGVLWMGSGYSAPYGLAVNPTDGSVWVAETGANRVRKLAANGAVLWSGGDFGSAWGVSVNPADGSVWVSCAGSHQVVHLAADGTELWRSPQDLPGTRAVSVNPTDGSVWIGTGWPGTGDNEVVHLSADGRTLWRGAGFGDVASVSVNPNDGSCWVANSGLNQIVHLVLAPDSAPAADDGSLPVAEDTPASGTLSASDPDGDPLTFSIVSQGTRGTATITSPGAGAFTYTPQPDAFGTDSFTFKVTDGVLESNVATVTVTIAPAHDLPTAVDDAATTAEDTDVIIRILDNDLDPDGDALSLLEWDSSPAHGAASFDAQGQVSYRPAQNFHGTDSFRYRYADGVNVSVATITVTVLPVTDPLVAVDDYLVVAEDESAPPLCSCRVTGNDLDVDHPGGLLRVIAVGPAAHGQTSIASNLVDVVYLPDPNYAGPDSFTYTACNPSSGETATATVYVTVTPVNDPPVAGNDSATTSEDTPVVIPVLANDTDIDGGVLSVSGVNGPAYGEVTVNPDGTITYSPDPDYNGGECFGYTVVDGNGVAATAWVTVIVTPVNDPPVAVDDAVTIAKDTPRLIDHRANDSDVDGDPLSIASFTQPAHGQVVANADGSLTYTPPPGYLGSDSFQYTISDGQGATATATVRLLVLEPYLLQVGSAQAAPNAAVTIPVTYTGPNTALAAACKANLKTLAIAELMYMNDHDGHYAPATTAAQLQACLMDYVGDPSVFVCPVTGRPYLPNPYLADKTERDVPYLPDMPMILDDGLHPTGARYVAYADGHVAQDQPDAEIAEVYLRLRYDVGQAGVLTLAGVRLGSGLPAGWEVTYLPEGSYQVRAIVYAPAGVPPLAPDSSNVVVLEFDFTVAGPAGLDPGDTCGLVPRDIFLSNRAQVVLEPALGEGGTFTVAPFNRPPVAVSDSVTTAEDTPAPISVLANDSDPDGDPLTVTEVTPPSHGNVVINADNTVTYTPAANYNGPDSFGYTITDGNGATASASVSLTVTAVNDPPVAVNDVLTVGEDGTVGVNVVHNDSDPEGDPLTLVSAWGASHGTAAAISSYMVSYKPAANYHGPDSFFYKIKDGSATATGVVTVTVLPVNDPPTAVTDEVTTNEDTAITIAVLANDSDVDGDAITLDGFTQPAHGTTTLYPDMTIRYVPSANWNGEDSFTYGVRDQNGATAIGTVNVTVTPVTDAGEEKVALWSGAGFVGPRSVSVNRTDGSCWVAEYSANRVTKLAASGAGLFKTSASYPQVRAVSVNPADGSCWLVDASGSGRVARLRETDGYLLWQSATLNAPESVCVTDDASDHTVWMADTGNNRVMHLWSTAPSWGSVTNLASPRSVSVDPQWNFCWAADTGNNRVMQINSSNDAVIRPISGFSQPWAVAAHWSNGSVWVADTGNNRVVHVDRYGATMSERGGFSAPKALAVNQADGSVWVADTGNNRILHLRSDGAELWHGDGFSGPLSVSVNSTDGSCWVADTGNNRVVRLGINHPPVAQNLSSGTLEDKPISQTLSATDPDGQALTYQIVQQGTLGLVSQASPGSDSFTYTPYPDKYGTDFFVYRANDGFVNSNAAAVVIAISAVNDPPRAKSDVATTPEDTAVTLPVLANDSDPENDAFTLSAVTQPSHGAAVMNADSTVTYTPSADYYGSDSFTYTISDASARTSTATVTVTVTPVNDPPVAAADSATTPEDTAVVIPVLGNDSDVENNALTITAFTQPAHGGAVQNADGSLTYTPAPNYNGSDSFTYTVSDGAGGTDQATVTITVTPVNDPPVAVADSTTTAEDTAAVIPVLGNDSDPENDALVVTAVSAPAHGGAVINPDGTLTYTPGENYNGPDSFTYTVSDGNGGIASAVVSITVTPVNDPPVAVDDAAAVTEDTVSGPIYPLVNDSDPDGDTVSMWGRMVGPSRGTVEWSPSQSAFFYTPLPDRYGPDSFTYKIVDGQGGSAIATINITVTPVNDPPMAEDDAVTTNEDTPLLIVPFLNDGDVDGLVLSVIAITQPSHGLAAIRADGVTLTYTPGGNYNGPDSFTYTVSDGAGGTDQATVAITVAPVNDPPVAVDDVVATEEDAPALLVPLGNDLDVDGPVLGVIAITQPSHGAAAINPDGVTLTYAPAADYHGPDSFTYTVSDGAGGTDQATVTITVTPVNDPPVAEAGGPYETTVGASLPLDGAGSADPDAPADSIVAYEWDTSGTGNFGPPSPGPALLLSWDDLYASRQGNLQIGVPFALTLRVTDGHGATATASTTLTVLNSPPEGNAGGPYETITGQGIALDGSGSRDPDASCGDSVVKYEWDVGGDGAWDKVVATPGASLTWAELQGLLTPLVLGQPYPITLRVTDGSGATATAVTAITVVNTPPTAAFTSAPGSPTTADTVSFTDGSADLEGPLASWSWSFGDGATSTAQHPSHQYATPGTYTVSLTVTDPQSATGTVSHDVTVSQAGNTQPGANVTVSLGSGVSVTFGQVTTAGETTVATNTDPPNGPPHGIRFLGVAYEVSTTAGYTGDIYLSITYNQADVPSEHAEQNLDIWHADGTGWHKVTYSLDTVNNIIVARITSFSWFALGSKTYDWTGFLPPIADTSKAFKTGSTIPVKFRISQDGQPVPSAVAALEVFYLVNGAPSGEPTVVSTSAGDPGNAFRYSAEDDLYIFNLSTKDNSYLGQHTYLARVTLDDGTVHTIQFSLK